MTAAVRNVVTPGQKQRDFAITFLATLLRLVFVVGLHRTPPEVYNLMKSVKSRDVQLFGVAIIVLEIMVLDSSRRCHGSLARACKVHL